MYFFPEIAAWQDQEGSGKKGTGIWRDPLMKAWRLVRWTMSASSRRCIRKMGLEVGA